MDEGFELLRLALNAPRFDADAIERMREQMLSALRRETTSPNDIATRLWWRTAFPDHPYGRPLNGTLESVPLITRDDLKAYVGRVLARDKLKIGVVGDIDAATLGPLLDKVFGALPAKGNRMAVAPARMDAAGRKLYVDLKVPQAVLSFGGTGVARKDPDFFAGLHPQSHHGRRLVLLAALQGSAREARTGLRRLHVPAAARRKRPCSWAIRRRAPTRPTRRST